MPILLEAKFDQQDLDEALRDAVRVLKSDRSDEQLDNSTLSPNVLEWLGRLLRKGAKTDYNDGEVFRRAFTSDSLDLLETLLSSPPSDLILSRLFDKARSISDLLVRHQIFKQLLTATSKEPDGIQEAVVELVDDYDGTLKYIDFLLERGASVNHKKGECMIRCLQQRKLRPLKRLLKASVAPYKSNFDALVSVCMDLDEIDRSEPLAMILEAGRPWNDRLETVTCRAITEKEHKATKLLLRHVNEGVSRIIESLRQATLRGDVTMLKAVSEGEDSQMLFTFFLSVLLVQQPPLRTEATRTCAMFLIEQGVQQNARDQTLLCAVKLVIDGHLSRDYVAQLLLKSCSVNGCNGEALYLASRHRPSDLFLQLLHAGASPATIRSVMVRIVQGGYSEGSLIGLLEACFSAGAGARTERSKAIRRQLFFY